MFLVVISSLRKIKQTHPKAMLAGAILFGICILFFAFALLSSSLLKIVTNRGNSKIETAIGTKIQVDYPTAKDITCQAGKPWAAPRCIYNQGGTNFLAVFSVKIHEHAGEIFVRQIKITNVEPYTSYPNFTPGKNTSHTQYEKDKSRYEQNQEKTT